MSDSYDNFIKQSNLKGRGYADGYNASHFMGLTATELCDVKKILKHKALEGDTIAINGIRYLTTDEALDLLNQVLDSTVVLSDATAQASYEAYLLSKDHKYIDQLFDQLAGKESSDRWLAVQLLCSINFGSQWNSDVENQFSQLLLQETDEVLTHSLAKKMLDEMKITRGTSLYKNLIHKLISSQIEVRKNSLYILKNNQINVTN